MDVLIPGGVASRARGRRGLSVNVAGVTGVIPRPNLLGALVVKAAAYTVTGDRNRLRHVLDFAVLSTLRRDGIREQLTTRDRAYLNTMIVAMDEIRSDWIAIDGAEQGISGLSAALGQPESALNEGR